MSERFNVVETTDRGRHEDIRLFIAEGLDRAVSLPEFGANDSFELIGSSGTSGKGGNSSGTGVFSS